MFGMPSLLDNSTICLREDVELFPLQWRVRWGRGRLLLTRSFVPNNTFNMLNNFLQVFLISYLMLGCETYSHVIN